MNNATRTAAIIGAGPAGLMAAEILSSAGVTVRVYDAMPSAGRKFLMAGKGGMNITHAEAFGQFLNRYGNRRTELEAILTQFSPDKLRAWAQGLGIATFVGSSGRVFPTDMKAAPLLRAWLHRLRTTGVSFHMRHRWLGWTPQGDLDFDTPQGSHHVNADLVVLALGGGSWPQLGSTASWLPLLTNRDIDVAALQPANCGFEVAWSDYFRHRYAGHPVKPVCLQVNHGSASPLLQSGEIIITEHGLEGGPIYALSSVLREEINRQAYATITLDLLPQHSIDAILTKLSAPRGKTSLSNHLRKRLGLDGCKIALLREVLSTESLNQDRQLATALKAFPIKLLRPRPLPEAISTAGGVCFSNLDQHLMLTAMPGVFVAGEMLDWDAPTGGYLLTACLATGRAAGLGALHWLQTQTKTL